MKAGYVVINADTKKVISGQQTGLASALGWAVLESCRQMEVSDNKTDWAKLSVVPAADPFRSVPVFNVYGGQARAVDVSLIPSFVQARPERDIRGGDTTPTSPSRRRVNMQA